MAKFRSIKNSLIAGEISPSAYGRTDLPQHVHACKTLKNMIPMLSGGGYRRPGTLFEDSLAAADFTAPRLIPFVVSRSESYMVALTRDLAAASATAGIVSIYRPTDTFNPSTAATVTGNHPYIDVNDDFYRQYEDVQFAQSVDVMTLVHPDYSPRIITRTSTDNFTVGIFNVGLSGASGRDSVPYRAQNTTAITLTPSATSGSINLTASAAFFNSGHVGALFKINHAGTIGCVQITGYTNSTTVTGTVIVNFGATSAQSAWWESAWSDYRGWPRSVGYFQGRRVYGGNATDRDSLWFSQANNYNTMSVAAIIQPSDPGDGSTTGPTGSQPFTLNLSSQELNEIQWVSQGETLVVGTIGAEFIVDRLTASDGFGCDNAQATLQSSYGSSYHQPVRNGEELIFALPSDSEIRALVFNDSQQSYVADPLQVFFDHYPKPEPLQKLRKYRGFCWDEYRKTLWCVDTAGSLFGMTRDRRLGVVAWHTHQMGGYSADLVEEYDSTNKYSFLCAGSVISVATIQNPKLRTNDVWLVVRRKVNGAYVYHIERFMGAHVASDTSANAWLAQSGNYYVDCATHEVNAIYLGIPETHSFSGYTYLEGETLTGTACAFVGVAPETGSQGIFTLRDTTVAAGVVTITAPYPPSYDTVSYEMAYGLPFSSIVEPVRIDAGSQIGTAQGGIKRIHKLLVRFLKTLSAKVGRSSEYTETVTFRDGSTPMGESPDLFTGDKDLDFDGDYDRDGYIYLLQDQPLPFAITAIIAEGQEYD